MSVLRLSWRARLINARDKFITFLGLVDDGTTYISAPNYGVPFEDLCCETTLSFIVTKGSLDFIALLGRGCDDVSVNIQTVSVLGPSLTRSRRCKAATTIRLLNRKCPAISTFTFVSQ